MSENKCPVCGEKLTGDIDGVVLCWSGCSFRCGGYALPRIAAAMELAKTIVESENCKAEDEYKYQEFVEWARQYVLEVFK